MWLTFKPIMVAFLVFIVLTLAAIIIERTFGTTKLLIIGFFVALVILGVIAWSEIIAVIRPLLLASKANYRIGLTLSTLVAVVVGVLFHFTWQYLALNEPAPSFSVTEKIPPLSPAIAEIPKKVQEKLKPPSAPKLQVRFSSEAPYTIKGPQHTSFRLGIHNLNPYAIGNIMVRIVDIRPRPRDPEFRTSLPIQLYDPNLRGQVVLNPGDEELFVVATTWTSGDGRIIIGDLNRASSGLGSFSMDEDERWDLVLHLSSATTQPREIVLTAVVENGRASIKLR